MAKSWSILNGPSYMLLWLPRIVGLPVSTFLFPMALPTVASGLSPLFILIMAL